MFALWTKLTGWMAEEKGASMVEYALLVVLIAIVALVAVRLAGSQVSSTFSEIGSGLELRVNDSTRKGPHMRALSHFRSSFWRAGPINQMQVKRR